MYANYLGSPAKTFLVIQKRTLRANEVAFKVAEDNHIARLGPDGHGKVVLLFRWPESRRMGVHRNVGLVMLHSLMTFL